MESEDGHQFIKNLARFIHSHEQALANALQSQQRRGGYRSSASNDASSSTTSLTDVFTKPFAGLATPSVKAAKLSLTPHHLYYLLTAFEELSVNVGTMSIRLENIHAGTPGNYVSFLGNAPKRRGHTVDTESLRSVSSVRSVMSNVSSIWSSIRSSVRDGKRESQHREDLRYLYSCFTKIPALRLAPDIRLRLVAGFEEFPFDTAVPIFVFKNLSSLEICDLDFRQVYGWDALSKQLRSLTIRRGQLEDPSDVLLDVVLDDMDKRRRRSSRALAPTTPSTPGGGGGSGSGGSWMVSPRLRYAELGQSYSNPASSSYKQRSGSFGDLLPTATNHTASSVSGGGPAAAMSSELQPRQRSSSPPQRPGSGSMAVINHSHLTHERRSSSSQGSSITRTTSRRKSVDLLNATVLAPSAWQFLRHLSLAENSLHYISVASLAPIASTLHSLDLSNNIFTEVPDALASLSQLRALNLSNCMIESLRSLSRSPLPAITTINLRGNRLCSLAGIDKLYSLEKIDLRENRFVDPSEMARLSGIPYLTHLYVAKNAFTKTHPAYRITIFNAFRQAPGRTEDVIIDQLGPMNNEKPRLVDMAPERPTVAVVKADVEEDLPAKESVVLVNTVKLLPAEEPHGDFEDPTVTPLGATSGRRKPGRKRVVQLLSSEPGSPRSVGTPVKTNESTLTEDSGHDVPTLPQEHDSNVAGKALAANAAYHEGIAALKFEHGEHWLSHMRKSNDNWTTTDEPPVMQRQFSSGKRTLG